MADQTSGDGTGATGPAYATADALHDLSSRVTAQNQELRDLIMSLMKSQQPTTSSPSTSAVPTETNNHTALPPIPVTTIPPIEQDQIDEAALDSKDKAFQRRKPMSFYGGTDSTKADKFLRNHEKIHDIVRTPEHMRAAITSGSLFEEADDWWHNLVATSGIPKTWLDFKK